MSNSAYEGIKQLRCVAKPARRDAMIGWTAANAPSFTLNTDGSVIQSTGLAAAGGVVRDCEGRVLDAFTMNLGKCSITRVELTSAVTGIERAWDMGI
ncbi:Putative ribonuclease H protein At1g65750 [Linum perenne]